MKRDLQGPALGREIAAIRKNRGLTLGEAARRTNGDVTKAGWARLETDNELPEHARNPMVLTLMAVSESLHIEFTITPEGLFIRELDPDTGVRCQSCDRSKTVFDTGWAEEHGDWYCDQHTAEAMGG